MERHDWPWGVGLFIGQRRAGAIAAATKEQAAIVTAPSWVNAAPGKHNVSYV